MDRDHLRAIITELSVRRSRRQVLTTVGRGAIGGVGAALMARGLGNGLLDSGLAPAARAQATAVNIEDFAFTPPTIEITAGSEVTWTNIGQAPHTATDDDGSTFDSGRLDGGDTFSHTFDTAGAFPYHCNFHPDMMGTVNVVEEETEPTKETYAETYVRRNLHGLDPAGDELTAYADAITAMQALPSTDPLSWAYQANIHGTWFNPPPPEPPPPSPEPAGWTTCEHFNIYFWPWHRMYLYWFERIIREMSGYSEFALPYWDYSDSGQRILPDPFLDPASPLFVDARDSNVNAGNPPVAAVPGSAFDYCTGLTQTAFWGPGASSSLEGSPHGDIHRWVGGEWDSPPQTAGWMGAFSTAARDPVFWLHHSNIDRLWESWLALGNLNPTDPAWLSHDTNDGEGRPYDFFDEAGTQVTTIRVVNEVLDAATLGYQYEALADISQCPEFLLVSPGGPEAGGATPEATPQAMQELGTASPEGGIEIGSVPTDVQVTLAQPEAAAGVAGTGGMTVLALEGVRGEGVPAVIVEIYVNLPQGQEPDFRSPYYVGNLNLFGLQPWDEGPHSQHGAMQFFDIARNVRALEARGEWTGDLQVTFVPYYTAVPAQPEAAGATPEAVALPPGPWATVESVSVETR